jgi:hypothetical protein
MPFSSSLPKVNRTIIAGHLHGGGIYTFNEDDRCPSCAWRGMLVLPGDVKVCGHCRNIDKQGHDLSEDQIEDIHGTAGYIFSSFEELSKYLRRPAL